MSLKFIRILILITVFTPLTYGQKWLQKIVPLQTNTSEVIKMFNVVPKKYGIDRLEFILNEGILTVGFSPDKCVETSWGKWNVENGTIVDIVFVPDKLKKPSFYKFKTDGFRQGYDQGHITYISDEVGLYFATSRGKVTNIHIYPSAKFNTFRCDNLQSE